jgi:deazaflavin-dependent oxidoreductase (nitroreductase family)
MFDYLKGAKFMWTVVAIVAGVLIVGLAFAHHIRSGVPANSHSGGLHNGVFRAATWLIKGLLRLGVPMGPMILLSVRGRKSGQMRTTPVDLFERDGRSYLVATHGGGDSNWVRNLRVAGEGTLTRGHFRRAITAVELPPEVAGCVLKDGLGARLAAPLRGYVLRHTLEMSPGASVEKFVSAARRHPVFELDFARKPGA